MATFVNSAGAAVAAAVKASGIWAHVGSGLSGWDTVPADESLSAVALTTPVGARRADFVQYCTPAEDGEIIVSAGRFTASDVPTKYLHVMAVFDNADAVGSDLREAGFFIGTKVKVTVPPSKLFLAPADIDEVGTLLLLDHFSKITKTADFGFTLDFVLTL
jgi:hypothetical protein